MIITPALKVEFRVPISANEKFLRMFRYLVESVRIYGGSISQNARFVISVSRDEPYRDLSIEYPWLIDKLIEIRWTDSTLFSKYEYDGTGLDRYYAKSDADVVIMCDADILVVSDLNEIILRVHHSQKQFGFIAHVSPFDEPRFNHLTEEDWWQKIFIQAGLSRPELVNKYTGEGVMRNYSGSDYRRAPYYFNFGFIISPNSHITKMAQSYEMDLKVVERVIDTWFKSQIVNTISYSRHKLKCEALSINYNFPLHVDDVDIRKINPDNQGNNSPSDIKVFHYLGSGVFNKEDFKSRKSLLNAIARIGLSESALVFQDKLKVLFFQLEKNGNGIRKNDARLNVSLIHKSKQVIRNQLLYLSKIFGVYEVAKKIRRKYYNIKFNQKYSTIGFRLIARLIDVYFWSKENFDLFGSSYFKNETALNEFFNKYVYKLVELNFTKTNSVSKKEEKEHRDLLATVITLFGAQGRSNEIYTGWTTDNKNPKLILTCGGRRTGTTLLNAILVSDDSTNDLVQEAQILTKIAYVLAWYNSQDLQAESRDSFAGNKECLYLMMQEFAYFIASEFNQRKTVVLKNPEFSLVIDELYEVFPNAIYIASIRDPRDQVVSELGVMKAQELWGEVNKTLDSDISRLANKYSQYITSLIQFNYKHDSLIRTIKYEKLVTEPKVEIENLEKITGLQFKFCAKSEWQNISDTSNLNEGPSRSQNYGRPISSTSIGSFKSNLSQKNINEIEFICDEIIKKYNYTRS